MAANPCVQCRVTPSTKTRLRAIAQEHQLTESALLKKLVETALLQTAGMTTFAVSKPIEPVSRGARLYVRLRPEDHVLLRERAVSRGMAAATYASILLRTHLRGGRYCQSASGCNSSARSASLGPSAATSTSWPGWPIRPGVSRVRVSRTCMRCYGCAPRSGITSKN